MSTKRWCRSAHDTTSSLIFISGWSGVFPSFYLDDDGAVWRRDGMVFRIWLLWDLRVETFWFVLNYYQHENDQQHQENVKSGA